MNRLKSVIYILLFFSINLFGQKISVPKIILSNVKFEVSVTNLPDSVKSIEINFVGKRKVFPFVLKRKNKNISANVIIPETGNYKIESSHITDTPAVRVIAGWLSIVPPLLAIFLALILRQVIISLSVGIYAGALIYYDFNPFTAILRFADTTLLNVLVDKNHMFIIVFTLLIGGVVGIISANGGTIGLAKRITRFAKTARSGMLSGWFLGILIFFDDYANSLIIGNMMRPITDKLKISREKLAYIVDSTAAPVASIVIISTWIGYEVGLISDGLQSINSTQNAYDVFIASIPYRFYPIAAIFFVFLTSYLGRDFGAMYKYEKKAKENGVTDAVDNAEVSEFKNNFELDVSKAKWFNAAVPIAVILFGTVIALFMTGINSLQSAGITEYTIQNIINHSDSFSSLLWASFIASIVAVAMSVFQGLLSLSKAMDAWQKGIQTMLVAVIILVFAWAISSITNDLKTADYIISLLSNSIDPRFLPALVFIICALISFSTGTSWGTMAIVMPIVIPLTYTLGLNSGLEVNTLQMIMISVISSVLAGSVFGDHCSPIADTTILSSLASSCNHINHVKTQLPYSLLVGGVTLLLGSIPTAFGLNPYISLILIIIALIVLLKIIGKKV